MATGLKQLERVKTLEAHNSPDAQQVVMPHRSRHPHGVFTDPVHGHGHSHVQPQQHLVSNDAVNSLNSSATFLSHNNTPQHQQQALNPAATRFSTMAHQQQHSQIDLSNGFFGHAPTMAQHQQQMVRQRQQQIAREQQWVQQQHLLAQQQQLPTAQRGYIDPVSHFNDLEAMSGANSHPALHQHQHQITNGNNQSAYESSLSNFNQNLAQQYQVLEQGYNDHQAQGSGYNTTTATPLAHPTPYHGLVYPDEDSQTSGPNSVFPTPHPTPSQQHQPVYGSQPASAPEQPVYRPQPPQHPLPQYAHGTYLSDYPTPPDPITTMDQARTHLATLEHYKTHTVIHQQVVAGDVWTDQWERVDVRDNYLRRIHAFGPARADDELLNALEDRLEFIEAWIKRISLTWDKATEEIENMYAGIATGEYQRMTM